MMVRFYSKSELVAHVDGLTVHHLEEFVETESVVPCVRDGETVFTESDVARLRFLAELTADFDLDADAAGLVMGLIDQIHGLRHELRILGEALAAEPQDVRTRIVSRLTGE